MHQLGPRAELLRHLEHRLIRDDQARSTDTPSNTALPLTVARWPITFQSPVSWTPGAVRSTNASTS